MADTSDYTPEPELTPETLNDTTTLGETINPGLVFIRDVTEYSRKFCESYYNSYLKREFLF